MMPYPEQFAAHFVGVGALIHHNNSVLLVKLRYGGAQKYWLIPGGLVEMGESLEEGLKREIKEETNLDVNPIGIIGIRSMVRKSDGRTDVYTVFSCELLSDPGDMKIQESEIADATWVNLDNLEDYHDLLDYSKIIIEKWQTGSIMKRDTRFDEMAKERIGLKNYEQYWV